MDEEYELGTTEEEDERFTELEEERKAEEMEELEENLDETGQEGAAPKAESKFSGIMFGLWLGGAIIADLLSLIPYVGIIASWPFAAFFWLFKAIRGLGMGKSALVSGLDLLAEGIFSTLPANTADVVITYFLAKAESIVAKVPIAGEAAAKLAK